MNSITIVGMGPGSETFLTIDAYNHLTQKAIVYLRTENHPVVPFLVDKGMKYQSFDYIYDESETFEETYHAIVACLIERLSTESITYAVPGNPFVAEKTVSLLLEKAVENNYEVNIIHGVSFLDAIITTLKFDPVEGLEVLDALKLDDLYLSTKMNQLWIQVYDLKVASSLKLKLMDFFEDDHQVKLIRAAGIKDMETVMELPLSELDHHSDLVDHLTSVFVPCAKDGGHEIGDLINIMKVLRSENGCPWDREQTHDSLIPHLIEEAYEVKHAIEHEDDEALIDELGDVLLQVVFHANIAEEDGYFRFSDIVKAITEKMRRRHPHVFGNENVKNTEEVLINWQAIKNEEKSIHTIAESMYKVPLNFPALMRSQKVQKRASDVGFDWESPLLAIDKVREELLELAEAIRGKQSLEIKEEMGDLLLIVSHLARMLSLDAEVVLNEAVDKFITRFQFVEEEMKRSGLEMGINTKEKMEMYWKTSKNVKRAKKVD